MVIFETLKLIHIKYKTKNNSAMLIYDVGAGYSGKTTFIEQLKFIHSENPKNTEERKSYVPRISTKILECMKILIHQAAVFEYPLLEENEVFPSPSPPVF